MSEYLQHTMPSSKRSAVENYGKPLSLLLKVLEIEVAGNDRINTAITWNCHLVTAE